MLYIPVTVLVFALMTACVSGISIDKGKYEDVNIVIQDTVVENDTLLKRIQVCDKSKHVNIYITS
jgi:hypothetical protein